MTTHAEHFDDADCALMHKCADDVVALGKLDVHTVDFNAWRTEFLGYDITLHHIFPAEFGAAGVFLVVKCRGIENSSDFSGKGQLTVWMAIDVASRLLKESYTAYRFTATFDAGFVIIRVAFAGKRYSIHP